ncbi:hypothetical protein L9F63_009934 [Diploptera punctata]|uniref:WD repeat-containing protein 34-like n=1 Tax=Diploptera punctata TaxID=6984 RepID=A0AAD8AIE9_DIPPU|nr:hypothetical protein L9F63_009934 [Diploptera punctata]
MFSDKSYDVVGFNSCWKTERELQDEEVQTAECSQQTQESQTNVMANAETQTGNLQLQMMDPKNVDFDKLAEFLKYAEPLVMIELDKYVRSQAFDYYEPLDDDIEGVVKKLHDLQVPNFNSFKDMYVSCLTWFCSGTVIACGYALLDHDDWCDHTGWVHIFNINRSCTSPSRSLEAASCLSCLSAHPSEPSILAAGLYDGEIVIWNFQKDDDSLICSSGGIPGSHRECVTQLSWINNPDTSQKKPLLVSIGLDGRILIWKVEPRSESFQLNDSFIITLERIKHLSLDMFLRSPVGVGSTGMEVGIKCFSFSSVDPTSFVLGVDGGIILACSTFAAKAAPVDADVPLKDPVLKVFDRHQGAVTCVRCSPHKEDKFVSCGTDNEIRIYLMKESSPIQVVHIEEGLVSMEWSLAYSSIVAIWGNDKETVEFFDLLNRKTVPSLQIPALEKPVEITALNWNTQNQHLMAVGDVNAKVIIWQLSSYKGE